MSALHLLQVHGAVFGMLSQETEACGSLHDQHSGEAERDSINGGCRGKSAVRAKGRMIHACSMLFMRRPPCAIRGGLEGG